MQLSIQEPYLLTNQRNSAKSDRTSGGVEVAKGEKLIVRGGSRHSYAELAIEDILSLESVKSVGAHTMITMRRDDGHEERRASVQ